jgi:hypothetical protein
VLPAGELSLVAVDGDGDGDAAIGAEYRQACGDLSKGVVVDVVFVVQPRRDAAQAVDLFSPDCGVGFGDGVPR